MTTLATEGPFIPDTPGLLLSLVGGIDPPVARVIEGVTSEIIETFKVPAFMAH
nr:hypothetical protein [uncultured Cohaesibacter sp.]